MGHIWDGITLARTLDERELDSRHALADAAKAYDWPRVLELLAGRRSLVNTTRPDGKSWFAPLHQAAHGGAPVEVVRRLIERGAWRSLRDARGERPMDIAERQGHAHLAGALEPEFRHVVPAAALQNIQRHFHEVIRSRASQLVEEHALRLPELEPLLELDRPEVWFAVPGMYGGFKYRLDVAGLEARLVCESWSRVVEGSGQRHEITSAGGRLVEEGFV